MDIPDSVLNMFVLASGICFLGTAVLKTYAEQMAFEPKKPVPHNGRNIPNRPWKIKIFTFHTKIMTIAECSSVDWQGSPDENAGWLPCNQQTFRALSFNLCVR